MLISSLKKYERNASVMTSWHTCSAFFLSQRLANIFFVACSLIFLIYACHKCFYLHTNWDVSASCFRSVYTFSPASSLFVFTGSLISQRSLNFLLLSLEQSIHDAQSVKSEIVLWHSWKCRNTLVFSKLRKRVGFCLFDVLRQGVANVCAYLYRNGLYRGMMLCQFGLRTPI